MVSLSGPRLTRRPTAHRVGWKAALLWQGRGHFARSLPATIFCGEKAGRTESYVSRRGPFPPGAKPQRAQNSFNSTFELSVGRLLKVATLILSFDLATRTCRVCHYAAQLRANSIFCGVEDGVVEVVLRDHLKQLRDKLGFGHAGCFRPLAQPGHRNSAEL
jgi:hypothetical protein